MLRILLVDDHKLFTDSLQFLLGTYGIEVVGVAGNGFEAIEKAESLKPDVVLLDIMMPGCNGIQTLKRIKSKMPEVKVVMLTTTEDDESLFQAIKLGASGYLLKSMNGNELVGMLLDLEKGGAPLAPKLATRLLNEFRRGGETASVVAEQSVAIGEGSHLSERQIEVLREVATGATYKEVGERLHITERTVKYHMASMMELLQMENKAQLIAYATQMGWTNS
ncbi:MAG: response regulator transcription factor [Christensenella sp.]|nr:response regulator transcription factor [Christensenella sp.]